jgi:hypothetical protein
MEKRIESAGVLFLVFQDLARYDLEHPIHFCFCNIQI